LREGVGEVFCALGDLPLAKPELGDVPNPERGFKLDARFSELTRYALEDGLRAGAVTPLLVVVSKQCCVMKLRHSGNLDARQGVAYGLLLRKLPCALDDAVEVHQYRLRANVCFLRDLGAE
jgi:hypothetical protein